ncbi:hypothetical protein Tco_1330051 [Tanacetum coccineum]
MADHLRPMEELLRIPILGIQDAIVVPAVLADQFELKPELLDFVSNNSFFGLENDDPHSHIRRFYQITRTLRLNQVPDDVVKLILFPFSLKGAAETWLENEPPCSITTWDDLVSNPTLSPNPVVESLSPSLTPSGEIDLLLEETDAFLSLDDSIPQDILFLENLLKDEPSKADKSEIYTLIGEPPDTFLMEDEEIELNPFKDIGDSVPIPRVSVTPLDSLDSFFDSTSIVMTNFDLKIAGDHRKVQLNELNELRDQAYENSLIYKEKTKKIHDAKIKNREFHIGDRVLLFNSRLKIFSGKLKSRWSGPFKVAEVFPYGTVELSQPDDPNFKVNGHRIKHYFGRDIPSMDVPDLQEPPKDN